MTFKIFSRMDIKHFRILQSRHLNFDTVKNCCIVVRRHVDVPAPGTRRRR